VGPTNNNPLWSMLVSGRDAGSTEARPVYQRGVTVRFASETSELAGPDAFWPAPRVVYLQHASDPITWWSPELLVREPGWLRETRSGDVPPAMRWYPFVTFWQVSADLLSARQTPNGRRGRPAVV
jgi:uncharacterized membrane protein